MLRAAGHNSIRQVCRRLYSTPSPTSPMKRVIFSGIQPTGIPHVRSPTSHACFLAHLMCLAPKLGNLLGALSNWVHLQNTAQPTDEVFYSTVGYHAITLPQDPKVLREDRRNALASLLAIGLDPKKSVIFPQDQVSECKSPPPTILAQETTGTRAYGASLDPQLYHPAREVTKNDHLEGKPPHIISSPCACLNLCHLTVGEARGCSKRQLRIRDIRLSSPFRTIRVSGPPGRRRSALQVCQFPLTP